MYKDREWVRLFRKKTLKFFPTATPAQIITARTNYDACGYFLTPAVNYNADTVLTYCYKERYFGNVKR